MANDRKSIGKRQRFRVFARDGYTCRYCGGQPPGVKLVIDHMIPVAEGGTNDDDNLITSCEPCNQGKSDKPLKCIAPTDEVEKRLAQQYLEQIELAEMAARAARARVEIKATISDYFMKVFDARYAPTGSDLSTLVNIAFEFGADVLFTWLDYTASKNINLYRAIPYICGIAKNERLARGDTDA